MGQAQQIAFAAWLAALVAVFFAAAFAEFVLSQQTLEHLSPGSGRRPSPPPALTRHGGKYKSRILRIEQRRTGDKQTLLDATQG
ncbi:MAG: hypothetical protein ACM3MF_07280, partial [Anaerolineae bacterium]